MLQPVQHSSRESNKKSGTQDNILACWIKFKSYRKQIREKLPSDKNNCDVKLTLTSWHWIRSYFSSVWVGIIRYPMKGHSETFSKRYNIFIIRSGCLWWVRSKVFTANWWCKFLFRMPIVKYYPNCAQLNLKWTGARHILCIGENVWFAGLWVTKGDANRDAVSHQSSATEHVTLHEIQTFNVRSWCRY